MNPMGPLQACKTAFNSCMGKIHMPENIFIDWY
jgi:hypothetical protein